MQAEQAAHDLNEIRTSIVPIQTDIQAGRTTTSKSTAHQATKVIESLRGYLQEWFDFQPTIQASIGRPPLLDRLLTQPLLAT
jgi:hypothetical protein